MSVIHLWSEHEIPEGFPACKFATNKALVFCMHFLIFQNFPEWGKNGMKIIMKKVKFLMS